MAKAAVAGDEKALDLFSVWDQGPMGTIKGSAATSSGGGGRGGGAFSGASENLNCYAGSTSGVVYFLNANGSCMEVC